MSRNKLNDLLEGTDRRSIGRANDVVALVLREPQRFPELIGYLWSDDPVLRMRAADAAEKISAQEPSLLQPFKRELLGLLHEAEQKELRWHLAQMIPRLQLTRSERHRAAEALRRYLDDASSIVKTFALQGLAELAKVDPSLASEPRKSLRRLCARGHPP
jgi:HEAT repeat protein